MTARRVIKILDDAYDRGFREGLTSSMVPNSGTYREGIRAQLNRQIAWAYEAGHRAGRRERDALVRGGAS